jgi:hypothetical protein
MQELIQRDSIVLAGSKATRVIIEYSLTQI